MQAIKTISIIGLIIWLYYLTYALYVGLIVNPVLDLGDGYDYHLPIAQSILSGSFLHPDNFKMPQWYYPGSGQLINSLFLLLHIPITLTNVVATILLFLVSFVLGMQFRLKYYFALLFAVTTVSLNVLVRWYNDMSLDVFVTIFFLLGIILLEKPQKNYLYFLKLGIIFGMLIGSKYSAIFLVIILVLVYGKKLLAYFNFARLIAFLIPFSVLGIFWYVRNYIFTQNPFYPIPILGLPGKDIFQGYNVFNVTLSHPMEMANAVFGEYNIWSILIFLAIAFYIYKKITSKLHIEGINRIYVIGFINVLLYFLYPTSNQPWIMVSSLRYSYPAFIPLILATFMLSAYYKKEEIVGYIAIGSMLTVVSMTFYPKLTLLYLPLTAGVLYVLNKYEKPITKKLQRNTSNT